MAKRIYLNPHLIPYNTGYTQHLLVLPTFTLLSTVSLKLIFHWIGKDFMMMWDSGYKMELNTYMLDTERKVKDMRSLGMSNIFHTNSRNIKAYK